MASTYSTNLKIELIGTGDQVGSWGNTTNTNLGTALEEAIIGYGAVQFTNDANLTLSLASSNASQTARKFYLYVTSTVSLTTQRDLIVPTIEKTYTVHNDTTGGQAIRVKTSAGTGIIVPSGKKMILYANGTNVVEQMSYATTLDIGTLNITTPLPVASGGTGASIAATARTNLGLGSIATQNANNVAITGGSITGITDLAIADGGTGASNAADARTNLGLGTIATQDANNVAVTGGSVTGVTLASSNASFTGTPTAPTAAPGTSTTQIATTAFVQNIAGSLGTMSTQNANNVAITGGSITGITDLAIADGGTGSSTANGALNNLLPTQTSNTGKYLKTDGTNSSWDQIDISTADITGTLPIANGGTNATTAPGARTSLGATTLGSNMFTLANPSAITFPRFNADNTVSALDAASFRTAIGAGTGGGSVSSVGVSGGTTGLTTSNSPITTSGTITLGGTLAVANGGTGATDATTARTNLGLGTIATQASSAVSITGGSITGITDLAVADGGTGASSFAANRVLLGNGTSAFQTVAPGTSGNVLTSNGTTWVSSAPFVWNVENIGLSISSPSTAYNIPANTILVLGTAFFSMSSNQGGRLSVQIKNSSGAVLFDYTLCGGNENNGTDGGSGMSTRSAWSVAIPAAAAGGSLNFYNSSGSNGFSGTINQIIKSA